MADIRDANPESHLCVGLDRIMKYDCGPEWLTAVSYKHLDVYKRQEPILHRPIGFAKVTLEDGCDIGVGAILLPGVTIGRNAQVGAGAVVTHSVAARTIVAGNPARVIRAY